MIIEIEDYNGNTLCAFEIEGKLKMRYLNCDIADEDGDYLFGTNQKLVRIQMTEELKESEF